jgi:hypothetical protein
LMYVRLGCHDLGKVGKSKKVRLQAVRLESWTSASARLDGGELAADTPKMGAASGSNIDLKAEWPIAAASGGIMAS